MTKTVKSPWTFLVGLGGTLLLGVVLGVGLVVPDEDESRRDLQPYAEPKDAREVARRVPAELLAPPTQVEVEPALEAPESEAVDSPSAAERLEGLLKERDPDRLLEGLEWARAHASELDPALLRALIERALAQGDDLELCQCALQLLALLDPEAFRLRALAIAERPTSGTGAIGAVLSHLGRLSGPDSVDVLTHVGRGQYTLTVSRGDRDDLDTARRKAFAVGAARELVRRLPEAGVRARLTSAETTPGERLVLLAVAWETTALTRLDARDAAQVASHLEAETRNVNPRDDVALGEAHKRLAVLAELPREQGGPALLNLLASGLPEPLVLNAAQLAGSRATAAAALTHMSSAPAASRARLALGQAVLEAARAHPLNAENKATFARLVEEAEAAATDDLSRAAVQSLRAQAQGKPKPHRH